MMKKKSKKSKKIIKNALLILGIIILSITASVYMGQVVEANPLCYVFWAGCAYICWEKCGVGDCLCGGDTQDTQHDGSIHVEANSNAEEPNTPQNPCEAEEPFSASISGWKRPLAGGFNIYHFSYSISGCVNHEKEYNLILRNADDHSIKREFTRPHLSINTSSKSGDFESTSPQNYTEICFGIDLADQTCSKLVIK